MKFFEIFKTTIKQYFVYRLNFLLWRFRVVINLLVIYFLWNAVFENQTTVFNYDKPMIISYIIISSLASTLALSSRTADVGGEIIKGDLVNYLLKPINFFAFQGVRDMADKMMNVGLMIIEISLLILILKPQIFIQTNPINYLLFFVFLIIGMTISFFINLSLSFIGFWSVEVWAPRFIFFIVVFFFSGSYFPLDILPQPIYLLLMMTPFPYLYYLPTKIYLGIPFNLLILFGIVSCFWLIVGYKITLRIWQNGIKSFSFYGR